MSKRDLETKLKARLEEWQAYGDRPAVPSEPATEHESRRARGSGSPDRAESVASVPTADVSLVELYPYAEPIVPDACVSELKAVLDRERDQSRRLLDRVAHEQVRHASTLRSRVQRPTVSRRAPEWGPWEGERPREPFDSDLHSYRNTTVLLIVLTLLIGVISYGIVYLVIY